MKDKVQTIFELISDTMQAYGQYRAPMLAASLAYYMIISLAPLLVLTVALASIFFGEQAVHGQLVSQIDGVVGREAAEFLEGIIQNASEEDSSGVTAATATIISTILLLLGASSIFAQLKRAINSVWGITQPPNQGFSRLVKTRILAFVMMIGVGVLLVLSLLISTILLGLNQWLENSSLVPGDIAPLVGNVLPLLKFIVSFTLMVGCFALLFKFVPDAEVSWQDVGLGAVVTAVLFSIGEYLLGFYLTNWTGSAAYGAAGSLILLLFWLYLSNQIFLFGAVFTRVHANKHGSSLMLREGVWQVTHQLYERPKPPPVPVIEEDELWETVDLPPRQRQKQLATGLIGLAIGLLLGFLGSLQRRS
jgi:membrane protein